MGCSGDCAIVGVAVVGNWGVVDVAGCGVIAHVVVIFVVVTVDVVGYTGAIVVVVGVVVVVGGCVAVVCGVVIVGAGVGCLDLVADDVAVG